MEWLNYNHLFYFWHVAREGSVSAASRRLRLTQPTISLQLRLLEQALGQELFQRSGRQLVLTDMGRMVLRYADEIFSLGRELLDTTRGQVRGSTWRMRVGIADVLPKPMVFRLLQPSLHGEEPIQLVCVEGNPAELLARLSLHELDVVLSDAPMPAQLGIRAFSHKLGESAIAVFGAAKVARAVKRRFPASLDGAPVLLPTVNTALRRSLDAWFEAEGIRPKVVAEFEDAALLKIFASAGLGLFVAAGAIEKELSEQLRVSPLGSIPDIKEQYYAISLERKVSHPGVAAMISGARRNLQGPPPRR